MGTRGRVLSTAAFLAFAVVRVLGAQAGGVDAAISEADRALQRGNAAEAQSILAQVMPQALALGASDARRAEALILMARAHRAMGDLAEPERLYREADVVLRSARGPESVEYARFLNEVGRYYHTRRKYDLAETFYRDAFRIRVAQLGQEHVEVADSLNNLAVLYENQARYPKAETYYRYALAAREKLLGADAIKTTETREHFARLLYRMQRTEEAEKLAVEARAVRQRQLAAVTAAREDIGKVAEAEPGLRRPELETRTEPDYTEEARIARHEGTVRLQVEIDADGVPRNPRVTQILGLGLDEMAIEAIQHWRFRPARLDGRKVPCRIQLAIAFSLL